VINLHIDPALLASPYIVSNKIDAECLVGRLSHWSSRVTLGHLNMTISDDCDSVLISEGAFPAFASIDVMLKKYGLERVYAAGDVARMVNNLLQRSGRVLDTTGTEVVDLYSFAVVPTVVPAGASAEIRNACQRAIATVRRVNDAQHSPVVGVLVSGLNGSHPVVLSMNSDAMIFDRTVHGDLVSDASVTGDAVAVGEMGDLVGQVRAADLWERATGARDLHLAIALHVLEIGSGRPSFAGLPKFAVGSAFYDSLAGVQAQGAQPHASVTLECCARLISGGPKYPLSPLLDVNGAQIARADGARAYRSHVTKGGLAVRLMTWERDGMIEFANTEVKHNVVIRDGVGVERHEGDYA
jgi:hypothetical protein